MKSDKYAKVNLPPGEADAALQGAPNPFDLESLRVPPNYRQTGKTKAVRFKIRTSQRAPREKFIRVHPFDLKTGDWCFQALMYEYSEDGTIDKTNYIVPAGCEAFELIEAKLQLFMIVAAVTRKGDLFLWEIKAPDPDGDSRSYDWHRTKLACASQAVDRWVTVEANTSQGAYECFPPESELPEPKWPDLAFPKMLELAYRDRIIRDRDHPVIKDILGIA